jgi:formylglycine-generating enzyme required for sulfatase activity
MDFAIRDPLRRLSLKLKAGRLSAPWDSTPPATLRCLLRCLSTLAMIIVAAAGISAGNGPSAVAGSTKRNPQDGLLYAWIPPGSFLMGCSSGDEECFSEETPAHQVTISQGFWMGQTEVTVRAYEVFAGIPQPDSGGLTDATQPTREPGEAMPIVDVTWDEAHDYCKWAGGRLPTEAEWEYAARAGSAQPRYEALDQIAWYQKNSDDSIHEVSQKRANRFGLFDMLGNAWEWVNDWYDGSYYSRSPSLDPAGPKGGTMHVLRGGSWMNTANLLRVSDRGRSNAELI